MTRATTSASNIHRRAACPGSERLEAGLPDEDSDQSREGVLLHSYASNPKLDRFVLKPSQRDLLEISDKLDDFIFERVREQFSVSLDEPFEEGFEKELYALPGSEFSTPGHCDLYWYWPERKLLVVIDRKFGFKVVTPAAANYQLRVYAIGGHEEWEVENCVVAITQPRLSYSERVTMAAYDREAIIASISELDSIRKACARPDAPLVAGEEQCRYCKAKLICTAYQAKLSEGFSIVPATDGSVAKKQADASRTLAECSDVQLDKVLVFLQFAEFVKNLARDEARSRIQSGQHPDFPWKLGKESENREIVDVKRAVALLSLRGDLTKDEILACASLSIGENGLEGALRKRKGLTWKAAKETLNATLDAVIERVPKRGSLTRVK